MSEVTLPGGSGLPPTVTVPDQVGGAAQQATSNINAIIAGGGVANTVVPGATPPALAPGQQGVIVANANVPGTVSLAGGYVAAILDGPSAVTVVGGATNGQTIIGTGGPLTVNTGTGSATVTQSRIIDIKNYSINHIRLLLMGECKIFGLKFLNASHTKD